MAHWFWHLSLASSAGKKRGPLLVEWLPARSPRFLVYNCECIMRIVSALGYPYDVYVVLQNAGVTHGGVTNCRLTRYGRMVQHDADRIRKALAGAWTRPSAGSLTDQRGVESTIRLCSSPICDDDIWYGPRMHPLSHHEACAALPVSTSEVSQRHLSRALVTHSAETPEWYCSLIMLS